MPAKKTRGKRRQRRPPPVYRVEILPPAGPPDQEAARAVLRWLRDRASQGVSETPSGAGPAKPSS